LGTREEETLDDSFGKWSHPTLILPPSYSSDSNNLRKVAEARGWNVHRAIRYQAPFTAGPLAVHGPLAFCDIIAQQVGLRLLDPPDAWLANLPREYLLRDVWAGTVADLHKVKSKAFIKPANDKVFQYGTYEQGRDVPTRHIASTCPILVSEVVAWDIEVRLWILDRKVVASEFYRIVGDHEPKVVLARAEAFGQGILDEPDYDLPSAVVIDVGHIEERGWAAVEANQAYACGIYGEENHSEILDVIRRSSDGFEVLQPEDAKYVRTYE